MLRAALPEGLSPRAEPRELPDQSQQNSNPVWVGPSFSGRLCAGQVSAEASVAVWRAVSARLARREVRLEQPQAVLPG